MGKRMTTPSYKSVAVEFGRLIPRTFPTAAMRNGGLQLDQEFAKPGRSRKQNQ
jgi:hypothetical protein